MRRHLSILWLLALLAGVLFTTAADHNDPEGNDGDEIPVPFFIGPHELEPDYGDTYTPEELAAIDRALWAANMTRTDMTFKKDYTEGHGCFPIVKEMMNDPLTIAPWMDIATDVFSREYSLLFSPTQLHHICYLADASISGDPMAGTPGIQHPSSPEALVEEIKSLIEAKPQSTWSDDELASIRSQITGSLAWHQFETSEGEAGYEAAKAATDEELYQLLSEYQPQLELEHPLHILAFLLSREELADDLFPQDAPLYHDTELGRICLGTPGDDYYEGDFVVLIEPGGNDVYHNCRIGAAYGKRSFGPRLAPTGEPVGASADYSPLGDGRIGYFVDLGGDDLYDCADVNITLGAAVLGVAAFYDLGGGDDRYYAGSCSLGAAMGGIATFYDDGGSDYYSGKVYTQGAAGFGLGIMVDDSVSPAPEFDTAEGNDAAIDGYITGESDVDTHSLMDNDEYTAWANAQAFARPRGIALCINRRGNETYYAGGVYLHAPLFADRYQSFSQGFAIGERGIDWAGGIALLIDYAGNDKYLGDIYNQGVGYWYGAGLLWDGGGNDLYEMTQYGQGSGIHLAVGGLVDVAGSDGYIMHSGLGQGSSHDLAVSVLHDREGNDRYDGNTTCNGGALTGSVGIFLDRSGDDTYAGKRSGSINYGDNRRINIALFCDLAGTDDYMLPAMADGAQWTQTNIGMGIDIAPPPEPEETESGGGDVAATEEAEPTVPIPEICSYEGELTQEVFDELWEIACRWEVGDNRFIVPKARERLTEFGADVLPYMSAVMDESNSGLAYRAYVDILGALHEEHPEEVYAVLRENAQSGDTDRETAALYLTGELKYIELEDMVVGFLEHEDSSLVRRAIGVLGSIESHAADQNLIDLLDPARNDEAMIKAAMTTLITLEVDCYDDLRPLLDYPLLSVRGELVNQLAAHWEVYGEQVTNDLLSHLDPAAMPALAVLPRSDVESTPLETAGKNPLRSIRSLLEILARADGSYNLANDLAVRAMLSHDDWGVRADAVRVIRHWQKLAEADEEIAGSIAEIVEAMEAMLAEETDPYVLFVAGEK
ncbi:calcium-binding protein [bacterium]|nr:calcium-binding protein [bacterium]